MASILTRYFFNEYSNQETTLSGLRDFYQSHIGKLETGKADILGFKLKTMPEAEFELFVSLSEKKLVLLSNKEEHAKYLKLLCRQLSFSPITVPIDKIHYESYR